MREKEDRKQDVFFDGRSAADAVLQVLAGRLHERKNVPRLAILHFEDPAEPSAFLREKLRAASKIGAECRLYPSPADMSARALSDRLNQIAHEAHTDGIVVQLPLPEALDANRYGILRILPEEKDVDCISERWLGRLQSGRMTVRGRGGGATLLPPVVAAIAHALALNHIPVSGKRVVILGWGDLVGKPCAAWFLRAGATVTVATSAERDLKAVLQNADIVVSGIGKPNTVSTDMVPSGAAVFDAGTSDVGGTLSGDVDAAAAKHASLFTPTPGGIGPLSVAMLFRNLVSLVAGDA